jgi:hypothetical protein
MTSSPNRTAPATVPIRTRIDRAELDQARNRAALAGMSLAEFVRQAVARYNPPPQASFPVAVLATVQEFNAIAVNLRQIATTMEGPPSTIAAPAADWFIEHITATHTGAAKPLDPETLGRVREQGQIINTQARAANAGQGFSLEALEAALDRVWQLMAGK